MTHPTLTAALVCLAQPGDQAAADPAGAVRAVLRAVEKVPADDQLAVLRATADLVRAATPDNVAVRDRLAAARATPGEAAVWAAALRAGLSAAADTLAFKPLLEDPLPAGFPPPSPAGEIRVQRYPAYRMAQTVGGTDGTAFFTLFGHITKQKIAMTVPVEMGFEPAGGGLERKSMGFLYRTPDMGRLGKDGQAMEVVDVPAQAAVSIGLAGRLTPAAQAEAKARLDAWLAAHADRHTPAGPVRVFGYNSPAVPAERQYAEVQIPVREKPAR